MNIRRVLLSGMLIAMVALPLLDSAADTLPNPKWKAHWIAHPDVAGEAYSVQHFRRVVMLKKVPETWRVRVSADPRCRLFVNGEEVWTGPARSDLTHWPYATLELAPYLKQGTNVLGATVWNHGEYKPWSQISERTGFILLGEGPAAAASTGPNWKVLADPSYTIADTSRYPGIPVGRPERFDARTHSWNWMDASFDDAGWAKPRLLSRGSMRGVSDAGSPWWLTPQTVPAQEQTPQRFAAIRRSTGPAPEKDFLNGTAPWIIPPRSRASVLLDQAMLTTAYPLIDVTGGRDATIRMKWAEALFDGNKQKGDRNEVAGRSFITPPDIFVLDGGARTLRTMAFRTWRYLELEIETADSPLILRDVRSIFTAYPFKEQAVFRSSDPSLADIWRVGWRTLRLCSGDTFYDCPYYEQLQYVGDTRVQALISLYVSGDDRLMKQAVSAFYSSRMPEGLTASRYPSAARQVIPPYSLFWIGMIHDYWMHRSDNEFVGEMLGGVEGVLNWYDKQTAADGLPGPLPWWNFGDWAKEWKRGVPPGVAEGGSAFMALQFVLAARQAADLYESFDQPQRAVHWRAKADRMARAVNEQCWVGAKGLYADTPEHKTFSQHVNSLAIVSGTVPSDRARALAERVLDDRSLTQCTLYFRFYVIRAMAATGWGDRYIPELKPWRDMLTMGLTTFAERPEPSRSDCHGWSACPNYDFLSVVCGIVPAAPGFRRVRIAPNLGPLSWAEASMPHPNGEIAVRFDRSPDNGMRAEVTLPAGTSGTLVWKGEQYPLNAGRQTLQCAGSR